MSTLVLGIKEFNKYFGKNVVENGGDFCGGWWGIWAGMGEFGGNYPINTPKNPGFSSENWR